MLCKSRMFIFGVILLVISPLPWVVFASDFTLFAQEDFGSQIYIPLVSTNNNEQVIQPNSLSTIAGDTWPIHMSEKGGYSISYPNEWVVTEGDKGTLVLSLSNGTKLDNITAIFLDFEKPEKESLLTWAENFFSLGLASDTNRTLSRVTLDVKDPDSQSQQVHVQYSPPIYGEAYLITRGRLVLQIFTHSDSQEVISKLLAVSNSVEFSVQGPTTQAQLSFPSAPPVYLTIDAWQQRLDDMNFASDALAYRLRTGEVAEHLLAIMSEQARQEYDRMVIDAAEYIAEVDRQREAQSPPPPTPNPGPNSAEYYEQERIYNEGLSNNPPDGERGQAGLDSSTIKINSAAITNSDDIANRRGVPTRLTTPIRTYPINDVYCSSPAHYNKDTYAIDIIVGEGTEVYGTTQNETVTLIVNDPNAADWGMYVWTSSQQYVRGITKTYYHVYAHLSQINVSINDVIQPTTLIGLSGNTGNSTTPHLHYQIHTHHNIDDNGGVYRPVDLSPVKGFVHNLNYPITGDCGNIENPSNTPIIIEANEFQYSAQPVSSGHYWNCSTFHPNHTGSCYRAAVPISPEWSLAPINYSNVHLTPRISYQVWFPTNTNYRIWVCGMGGTVEDDSLHIGRNSNLPGTADDMSGYHSSSWKWASVVMDNSTPYLLIAQNYNNIDLYVRENGMRVDRILLTKSFGYNPTNSGIRCGAEGL